MCIYIYILFLKLIYRWLDSIIYFSKRFWSMHLMIGWLHLRSQDPTRFSAAVLVGGRSQDHSCECICAYTSIEYAWVYGLSPNAVRVTTKVATMVGNDSRTLCGTFHCYWVGGGTWQSFRIFLEHWLRRREPGWFSYSCPDKSWYLPIMIAVMTQVRR